MPLTETPPGSGSYTGSVPPLSPVHGNVTVGSMVYCAPLTGVLPYAGPTSGGTAVTIYGSGFTGATAVHFGSAAATAIQVVSDSEITALTPAGTGTVRVTVTTPSGTTAASSLAEFAYLSVASVAPNTGNVSGDGTVLITGTGFSSAEQVYFGSTRTLFSVVSPTEIIAWVPPASAAGVVDITVETSGGTSPTSSADQFTYSTTAPTPSTPQQIPLPPVTGTPPICSSSGGPSVCAAPPDQRISSSPPLMQGNGGSLPAPGEILSSISSGYTYATTEGDAPPDNSGDWTSFLQSDGTTDWIGDIGPLASIGDNVNSIMDGDAFASDIAESEDFDGGFGSLSDTLAEMLGDSALEDSFLDFALGPVGGVALAAFQMYCNSANPSGFLGGACAVASVPSDLLGLALTGATSLLQKLWDEYIDPSGTVVDDKGNTASSTTSVGVSTPPPPPQPPAPMASSLCTVSFEHDAKRPTRVDNEAKACLDDVALVLQHSSDAQLALVGNTESKESATKGKKMSNYAAERAVNTKDYLVTEKGIDPSRVMVYTGTDDARTVTTTLVPAGATNPAASDTPVDENAVKAVRRTR